MSTGYWRSDGGVVVGSGIWRGRRPCVLSLLGLGVLDTVVVEVDSASDGGVCLGS